MSTTEGYLVGLDVGTTSVKAGLFTLGGSLADSVSVPYPTSHIGPLKVEQNPQDWLRAVYDALGRFAARADAHSVVAVGLTSQVNTHVFCDKDIQELAPAIVWKDGRAASQAAKLDAHITQSDRMSWWGAPMPLDASHAIARIQWMREADAATWDKTRHVLLPKDYCIYQLTGELASDPWSNIGLVDQALGYIPSLLDLVPGARPVLPPLAAMTTIAGEIKAGLPFAGVPVAVGTMDAWAGAFGTGATQNGSGMYLSGTSEILGIVSTQINPTPGVLVMPRSHDITMHIGPTQSGGASQLWFCELLGIQPEEMAALAAQHDPGKICPVFLPHLQGERAPIWDAGSRGVFLGLDASTDRAAMSRAVYEGVAFSARWLLEALQQSAACTPDSLRAGGGGFRSDVWSQIRADILGLELSRVATTDPGTLGAAGIAAVAAGLYETVQAAFSDLVKTERRFKPDTRVSSRVDEQFSLFKETWSKTSGLSHRWLELSQV